VPLPGRDAVVVPLEARALVPARELLAGWVAERESARRSERIKIGLDKRKAQGKPVGRQPGSADKAKRKRSGYVAAWEDGGARRASAAKPES